MKLLHLGKREPAQDYWLGFTTALVAGLVNVCSVMAFFALSSNVTGHVAIFVEEVAKGHWHQVFVVSLWVLAFLLGAFAAHALIGRGSSGHAPLLAQGLILVVTAYYGHRHYLETLQETEALVGALLFGMGLQNGAVSTISNSVVRTTHLTGLFTDLGMELSAIVQGAHRRDRRLVFKLQLHLLILAGYLLGGLLGGLMYLRYDFHALYAAAAILAAVLANEWLPIASFQRAPEGRNHGTSS